MWNFRPIHLLHRITFTLQGGKANFAGRFFFDNLGMLQDIELKFCIETIQTLTNRILKQKIQGLSLKLNLAL